MDRCPCAKDALRVISVGEIRRPTFWKTVLITVVFASASQNVDGASARLPARPALLPPVAAPCVSSPFGPRILPGRPLAGTFHDGIDLPAPLGSPVVAVAPGTILRVQRHGIGGLEMLIQHDGFVGVYSHLGLITPVLAEGRKTIYGGERIATVGHTGLTYGPHLYFGMIINGHPVDPAPYLDVSACGAGARPSPTALLRPTRTFAQY